MYRSACLEHALNNFSSSIDKVSFKKNSMSLGLVVLEKLPTRTLMRTRMSQSKSADIKKLTVLKNGLQTSVQGLLQTIKTLCISINYLVKT